MLPAVDTPAPLPARPRGQPKSPWRLRKEAEAQALANLEAELVKAVQEGRGHEVLYAAEVALARLSFSKFCQMAWHVLEPSTHLEWGRHHELICTTMQALFEDWYATKQDKDYIPHVRNVVFNLPPGSLKSRILAVMFQAWCWIRAPGMKLVCISVNEAAALRDARDTRALMASDWYQTCFQPDWSIKDDQDAITDFGNTSGGNRLSKPSGSVIVGLRGDCVAGETVVTTSMGPVTIAELHAMAERDELLPLVWSRSDSGLIQTKPVQATRKIDKRAVVEVVTQCGKTVTCTPDHRIYVDGDYVPASKTIGRQVVLSDGSRSMVVDLRHVGYTDVYDIQVADNHNFFANGLLVHNCLIVDDANDPEKAYEETERNNVNSLWETNQYNRVNDPLRSLRVCIQQRVHVEDHTGYIIKKQGLWSPDNPDGWLHVVLPAEFELKRQKFELPVPLRKRVCHLPGVELCDWRTKEGEALHPARMTPSFLASEKKRWAGTSNYAGQMQQRPAAEGGGKIKKEWFGWFRLARGVRPDVDDHETGRPRPDGCDKNEAIIVPAAHHRPGHWDFDLVVISVDPAYKKTERGSLWGMLAFGCKGGRRYLLDDRSQRGEPDEAIAIMKDLVKMWHPDKILIEDKAGGAGMYRTLEIEMGNGDIPMVELELVNPGTQDKDVRVNTAIPTMANGMLYLREGAPWIAEYVEELTLYPNGVRNDRVDATTQCINHIRVEDVAFPSASAWSKASGF